MKILWPISSSEGHGVEVLEIFVRISSLLKLAESPPSTIPSEEVGLILIQARSPRSKLTNDMHHRLHPPSEAYGTTTKVLGTLAGTSGVPRTPGRSTRTAHRTSSNASHSACGLSRSVDRGKYESGRLAAGEKAGRTLMERAIGIQLHLMVGSSGYAGAGGIRSFSLLPPEIVRTA